MYQNGFQNAHAAVELPFRVKFGPSPAKADRIAFDDALPNNWPFFVDNALGTGKIPYLNPADANNVMQLMNPNGVAALAFQLLQLATPGTPTITTAGTAGATTVAYKIVAKSGRGATLGSTPASAAGQTTTANATLTATNFNVITFPSVPNAVSYDIYRTSAGGTPSTTGLIGSVTATFASATGAQPATYVFNDTGLVADGTTAPTANTTGAAAFAAFNGDLNLVPLTTPVGVVATPQGVAGATTITYKIVARGSLGTTAASSAGTTTTANATLTAANNVLVTWDPVPGALSYDIYRTAAGGTPNTTGKLANVLAPIVSFTDTGVAGDTTTPPTVNTTGTIGNSGGPSSVGQFVYLAPDTPFSNAGGNTITAVQMIEGNIVRTGGGAQTDTTDTAANIVAAIPNAQVGHEFQMIVYNNSGGLHTLALGSGVTARAGITVTLTTTAANAHIFVFRITNVGTPAVTIYSAGQSAS